MKARLEAMGKAAYTALAVALVSVIGSIVLACSQTPTSVPVRTFERAQRMDTVCLRLFDRAPDAPAGAPLERIVPVGLRQDECAPVPGYLDGSLFQNQLFAVVTQTTRGEVAVVDLSAGALVDQSLATPGVNFLPVGAIPSDVAATPDGRMIFVGSAEPNKAAIYGIPTRRLLGDTPGHRAEAESATLGSWPVCSLDQSPGALLVVPRKTTAAGDGGADGGAGADAGAAASGEPEYDLVAIMPGERGKKGLVVTLDTRPFRRGGLPRLPNGDPDYATAATYDPSITPGETLRPGEVRPCAILSAIELVGESAVPASVPVGPTWDDGVKYVDGGVNIVCDQPSKAPGCGLEPCGCSTAPPTLLVPEGGLPEAGLVPVADPPDAGPAADGGDAGVVDAGPTCETPADAGAVTIDLAALDPPRLVTAVRDEQTLYIADEGVPLIHVVDLSTRPAAPREMPPFVATSLADPTRVVKIRDLALSPPTSEYKRFLYAVDRVEGSIMIFDVTNPETAPRSPMLRPHPELNPFQPADRIAFSIPVVAVSFARNDFPLGRQGGVSTPAARSGLLCNPNPALAANPAADPGYYYRANNATDIDDVELGPRRLRGIFGFATLGNGRVMVIDVDDWDAPCRRPNHLASPADLASADPATKAAADDGVAYPPESSLTVPQPASSGPEDFDRYHVPHARDLTVTNEQFSPVVRPHSLRSDVLIRDDANSGNQLPRLTTAPTVSSENVILPFVGPGSEKTPRMSTRISFESPEAHVNQDWRAVYEGTLPGFTGLSTPISTTDNYASVVLSQTQAGFCTKGIEDWAVGSARAERIVDELERTLRRVPAEQLPRRVSDYVQLNEELLDRNDPYWGLSDYAEGRPDSRPDACWEGGLATASGPERYDACLATFGAVADKSPTRDFPILEAYADKLVLGRFFTFPGSTTREVVYKQPSNASLLKRMRCCFHQQVKFDVRAAGSWVLTGKNVAAEGGIGFLNHMTTDAGGRCVTSCDPREALLNGRVPAVPVVPVLDMIGRDSPLAVRNPMFAVAIANPTDGTMPFRDTVYTFSTRGEFRTLVVNVAGSSTAVSPQSMRFIEPLGQIGVVDAASQGLVLIDLRAVTVARAPYF